MDTIKKTYILFLLILTVNVFSIERTAIRRNIITGMNTKNHSTLIGLNEAVLLRNFDLRQPGKHKKRSGYLLAGDDQGSNCFKALERFDVEGGTNCILGVEGTNLTYWTGTGNWASPIKSDLSNDLFTLLLVGNDYCLVSNGIDNVHKVDASFTVTDLGDTSADPTKSTVGVFFNSRFFMSVGSQVYFSDVVVGGSDPVFDRTTNFFKINIGDNDEITNMIPYREDQLIIFKEHSTWWLNIPTNTDPLTNWTVKPIDNQYGAVCKRGAVKAGSEIYYISHDGLRSLSRTEQDKLTSTTIAVSDPIYNDWVENIRYNKREFMRLEYFNNMIIWGVPVDHDYIDYWFVYFLHSNTGYNGWAVWDNMNTSEMTTWFDNGEEKLFFGEGNSDGKMYEMFSGTDDNGEDIEWEYISRTENLSEQGAGANKKQGFSLYMRFEPAEDSIVNLYGNADDAGFTSIYTGQNLSLDVDNPVLPVTLPFTLSSITTIRKKMSLSQFNHWYDFQIKMLQTGSDMEGSLLDYLIVVEPQIYVED